MKEWFYSKGEVQVAIQESKEECYQKTLEFIIEHALYQDAWYVLTARDALGKERSYEPSKLS